MLRIAYLQSVILADELFPGRGLSRLVPEWNRGCIILIKRWWCTSTAFIVARSSINITQTLFKLFVAAYLHVVYDKRYIFRDFHQTSIVTTPHFRFGYVVFKYIIFVGNAQRTSCYTRKFGFKIS